MRIRPEKTMALAIDYQEKLVPAVADQETLLKNSRILLAGLEILEIPTLVSRQYPQGLGDTLAEIKAVTGAARVFDKTDFSCYQDRALKEAIDGLGRKNVIICGVEAHICNLQTAVDLLEADYHVIFVADCMSSRDPVAKEYGLQRAVREGARLATHDSILFELTVGKSSPAFKAISKLVK